MAAARPPRPAPTTMAVDGRACGIVACIMVSAYDCQTKLTTTMRASLGQRVDTFIFAAHLSELIDTRGSRKDPVRQHLLFQIRQRPRPILGAGANGAWADGPRVVARSAILEALRVRHRRGVHAGAQHEGLGDSRGLGRCRNRAAGNRGGGDLPPLAGPCRGRLDGVPHPDLRARRLVGPRPVPGGGGGRRRPARRPHARHDPPPVAPALLEARARYLGGDRLGPQCRVQDRHREVPWLHQVTFSIWPDKASMNAFARGGPHARAIRAVREEGWFREELYARFRVEGGAGSWGGHDPLVTLQRSST